jgi:hypothetical protein
MWRCDGGGEDYKAGMMVMMMVMVMMMMSVQPAFHLGRHWRACVHGVVVALADATAVGQIMKIDERGPSPVRVVPVWNGQLDHHDDDDDDGDDGR